MAGFDLKEGLYEDRIVSDDELWSALSVVFTSKSVNDTSYKFGFLKAIIDNLYNVDEELKLTFDQLFSKFGEIYWNLVLKYGLRQKKPTKDNRETSLERVLHYAVDMYAITPPIPYESLSPDIMIDISHRIKMKCKENVVGALYADTRRLFYSFSKKGEWIQINPQMYSFVCKHKVLIEKLKEGFRHICTVGKDWKENALFTGSRFNNSFSKHRLASRKKNKAYSQLLSFVKYSAPVFIRKLIHRRIVCGCIIASGITAFTVQIAATCYAGDQERRNMFSYFI